MNIVKEKIMKGIMNIQDILKSHKKRVTPERIKLYNWMKEKHLFTSSELENSFF